MGWPTKYKGPEIDEALEKGRNLRIVNNGWIRLESSSSSPVNLGTLKNVGNYTMLYYSDHPSGLSEMYMPININIIRIDNKLYQIGQFGNLRYIRNMDVGGAKYGPWEIDQSLGSINIGPTAPANPVIDKTIWLDTSDPDHATLKIYTSSGWKEVVPDSAMREEVYDTQGKHEDIFQYIDKAIQDASIGSAGIDFKEHIENATIHVTQADKDKWNNAATMEDIENAKNSAITSLESQIDSSVNENLGAITGLTQEINTVNSNLQAHTGNTTIHPTEEQQQSWDAKADADHTHYLDGKVTVDKDHVIGELSSDMMPYDVKERVYVVNSDEERLALTKNPLHNGDAVCVSPEDGSGDMWYYVVDDTKLGDMSELPIQWTETSNGLSDRSWNSICYGNNKFIAISGGSNLSNTFAYSSDGITWTETSNGLSSRNWYFICYGNGKYVAIAYTSNTFAYSTDGINWKETSNGLSKRNWQSICYGNGKYVAVSGDYYGSNTFAYSTDGINWTETTNGLSNRGWMSIYHGNGKYVAISGVSSSNTFAYSTDGINWTETSNGLSNRLWVCICYGNGKYVAVAANSNTFAYSTDGINWTETSNGLSVGNWESICYGNDKYVAGMWNSTYFAYSIDGINWTVENNGISSGYWNSICYGKDKYVITIIKNIFGYWDGIIHITYEAAFKEISTSGASLDWNSITNKPTTIAGYGITDVASDADISALEQRVEQAEGHLMTLEDLSNITTVEAKYDEALAAIEEIDSAFIDLDTILTKLENIAK